MSSQIEGTQSSLSDLLVYEMDRAPGVPIDDTQEVLSYLQALQHGLQKIQEGYPISLHLLRDMHAILLRKGRGAGKSPGAFRNSQNRIGGTWMTDAEFVPPPADLLPDCLEAFESFLQDRTMPVFTKAALAHVQFETIHPFEDGNGRVGRLLITLLLGAENVLHQPTLYLSLYFKNRRTQYYDCLQSVRTEGRWEEWLRFFLTGVYETSQLAVQTARRLRHLFSDDYERIQKQGRIGHTALQLHHLFQQYPVLSVPRAAAQLGISQQALNKSMELLQRLGIVREITGQKRNRLFIYSRYVAILNEGTEPLSSV